MVPYEVGHCIDNGPSGSLHPEQAPVGQQERQYPDKVREHGEQEGDNSPGREAEGCATEPTPPQQQSMVLSHPAPCSMAMLTMIRKAGACLGYDEYP